MKKLLGLMVMLLLVVSFSSCGKDDMKLEKLEIKNDLNQEIVKVSISENDEIEKSKDIIKEAISVDGKKSVELKDKDLNIRSYRLFVQLKDESIVKFDIDIKDKVEEITFIEDNDKVLAKIGGKANVEGKVIKEANVKEEKIDDNASQNTDLSTTENNQVTIPSNTQSVAPVQSSSQSSQTTQPAMNRNDDTCVTDALLND